MRKLRFAVLGTGVMGSQHARILSSLPSVELRAVCDKDKTRANAVAKQFNIPHVYTDYNVLLEQEELDAVIVAFPTMFHKEVVLASIEKGCHVLVEKPIAATLADAKEMTTKAKKANVIFTVGHVERFNPVVEQLKQRLERRELGDPYLINTVRIGPFPKRLFGQADGVLVDLASHDADIIHYLIGDIRQVFAQLILSGKQEIYAKALFKINSSIQGSSEFSWISPQRKRNIDIFGTAGLLSGDYQNQTLTFSENGDTKQINPLANYYEQILKGYVCEGRVIQYPLQKAEPLLRELEHFIECITKDIRPKVLPIHAMKALSVALALYESGYKGKSIKIKHTTD